MPQLFFIVYLKNSDTEITNKLCYSLPLISLVIKILYEERFLESN